MSNSSDIPWSGRSNSFEEPKVESKSKTDTKKSAFKKTKKPGSVDGVHRPGRKSVKFGGVRVSRTSSIDQSTKTKPKVEGTKQHKLVADEFLSDRSRIYRARLIDEFRLTDIVKQEATTTSVPMYYSTDFLYDESNTLKTLQTFQQQILTMATYGNGSSLVRYNTAVQINEFSDETARGGREPKTEVQRENERRKHRLRVRTNNRPPLSLWAHLLVQNPFFNKIMLLFIIVNSIVLGAQAELQENPCSSLNLLRAICQAFDIISTIAFAAEIVIKLMADFSRFWKNPWNVFDFIITVLTIAPDLLCILMQCDSSRSSDRVKVVANNIRSVRILRTLKLVTRFEMIRLIALAIAKSFKEMLFICVLLLIFLYIFGLVGVTLFESFVQRKPSSSEPSYMPVLRSKFSTQSDVMMTLFQLFTLDHWYEIFIRVSDNSEGASYFFYVLYIGLWILVSSFIFQNIFVGIMVNNFQSIRQELFSQMLLMENAHAKSFILENFQTLMETDPTGIRVLQEHAQTENPPTKPHIPGEERGPQINSSPLQNIGHHIDESVKRHRSEVLVRLDAATDSGEETLWSRDILFEFMIVMENLLENLEERKHLTNLLSRNLLRLHDIGTPKINGHIHTPSSPPPKPTKFAQTFATMGKRSVPKLSMEKNQMTDSSADLGGGSASTMRSTLTMVDSMASMGSSESCLHLNVVVQHPAKVRPGHEDIVEEEEDGSSIHSALHKSEGFGRQMKKEE